MSNKLTKIGKSTLSLILSHYAPHNFLLLRYRFGDIGGDDKQG